ncbi:MAG: MlaA family lipoprotein [Advenella sp.]|uniref:Lipoprotein n=1 Tax=Advenella kashmirensis TaxID=310575 RepID=A0A356LIE5_9BURK|nr:VacJ family lipoprotein [Advenella sp. FME57]HBP30692.1 hypothetical protein [Advenella kashmirensis]
MKQTQIRLVGLGSALVVLAGCASVKNPTPGDPLESYNRSMFSFNDAVDRNLLTPVAKGYQAVVPSPVRTCVTNIFNNFGDIWSGVNSFLQGRGLDSVNTFGRVLFNSTMGLGGCIDVASMKGAPRIQNDFGTTLGVWGIGQGPYFVLPLLGPSTFRDTAGTVGDGVGGSAVYASPGAINDVPVRNTVWGVSIVNSRANLLNASDLMNDVALDRYSFLRDAYLQRRQALLNQKLGPVVLDQPGGQSKAGSGNLPSYDDPEAGSAGATGAAANPNLPMYDDPEAAPAGGAAQSAPKPASQPSAASRQQPAGSPAGGPANADSSVPVYTDPEGK